MAGKPETGQTEMMHPVTAVWSLTNVLFPMALNKVVDHYIDILDLPEELGRLYTGTPGNAVTGNLSPVFAKKALALNVDCGQNSRQFVLGVSEVVRIDDTDNPRWKNKSTGVIGYPDDVGLIGFFDASHDWKHSQFEGVLEILCHFSNMSIKRNDTCPKTSISRKPSPPCAMART